jgi:hypothetical protein
MNETFNTFLDPLPLDVWRRVANYPALQGDHFTVEQLEALYGQLPENIREYFGERASVFECSGVDHLAAVNFAHIAVIDWMEAKIERLDADEIELERQIIECETSMRAAGFDPELLYNFR